MELKGLDQKWRDYLKSDACPPVLGLAPLSPGESQTISDLIKAQTNGLSISARVHELYRLMQSYPAVMVVWLSRKAFESYDEEKGFFDHFEEKIGVPIPVNQRKRVAEQFRSSCACVMSNFVPPQNLGAWIFAGEFLFQAGLPIKHIPRFVTALHAVTGECGLSDSDDADAVADLRSELVGRADVQAAPVLGRALSGETGTYILQIVLRVLNLQDYTAVNPDLAKELVEKFGNDTGRSGEAVRWPYLRLGEDWASFKIVGPKQPERMIGSWGLEWAINGVRYRVGMADDFIFPLSGNLTANIELHGLRAGRSLKKAFDLNVGTTATPFLVFSCKSQKLIGTMLSDDKYRLPCGDYLVVHDVQASFGDVAQRHPWQDRNLVTTLLCVRPGVVSDLKSSGTFVGRFSSSSGPFIEPTGQVVITDDGQRIHYGWNNLPSLWVPSDDVQAQWKIQVTLNSSVHPWPLRPTNEVQGEHTRMEIVSDDFLVGLNSALHQLGIEVFRESRKRCSEGLWYWKGLQQYQHDAFTLDARPKNLVEYNGFDVDNHSIRHRRDDQRQHQLCFAVGGDQPKFIWSQPGIFVESFFAEPGKQQHLLTHNLGESFVAEVTTSQCLRIWFPAVNGTRLLVGGQQYQLFDGQAARLFTDLRLDNLATTHPNGGIIELDCAGITTLLARFARPLSVSVVVYSADVQFKHISGRFNEASCWVQFCVRDLVSNKRLTSDALHLMEGAVASEAQDGLPILHCEIQGAQAKFSAPKDGWPTGIWLIECEVRRDETAKWQPLTGTDEYRINDERPKRPVLLIRNPPVSPPAVFREQCFWYAFRTGLATPSVATLPAIVGNEDAACSLLGELSNLLSIAFHSGVWQDLRGLEILYNDLSMLVSPHLHGGNKNVIDPLLALVKGEHGRSVVPSRSLLIALPELLALPAEHYRHLESVNPLHAALRWCSEAKGHALAVDAFREMVERLIGTGDFHGILSVLQCFETFPQAVQPNKDPAKLNDLHKFNFQRYFQQTIRAISHKPQDGFWSEKDLFTKVHFESALARAVHNRDRGGTKAWAGASTLFARKEKLRSDVFNQLRNHHALMPANQWQAPWVDVQLPDDVLIENCNQFASVFALATRAAAAGWISLEEALANLRKLDPRDGRKLERKGLTMLVRDAPDLLGFYLMFWELMISTYPHV